MLSIAALHSSDAGYYYQAPELSLPGERWVGRAFSEMGVGAGSGDPGTHVNREQLEALLGGRHPVTGQSLASAQSRERMHNVGYDAVFSAPKSVSLISAIGPAEVVAEIRHAHEHSVDRAFGYLESEASALRRYSGGKRGYISSNGFTAGAFSHGTSRALDPHLHTHVVFPNVARGDDGRWSSFNSAFIWGSARTAGFVYGAELRHEVTRRLGLEWGPVSKGMAELQGISRAAIDEFSTRRGEIEAHLLGRGVQPGHASHRMIRAAALVTRRPKPTGVADDLADQWRRRALKHGIDEPAITTLIGRSRVPDIDERAPMRLEIRVARSQAVKLSDRTLLRQAVRSACEVIPPGADPSIVGTMATQAVESRLVSSRRSHERPRELGMSIGM